MEEGRLPSESAPYGPGQQPGFKRRQGCAQQAAETGLESKAPVESKDPRGKKRVITRTDVLMSALAMFKLKCPSFGFVEYYHQTPAATTVHPKLRLSRNFAGGPFHINTACAITTFYMSIDYCSYYGVHSKNNLSQQRKMALGLAMGITTLFSRTAFKLNWVTSAAVSTTPWLFLDSLGTALTITRLEVDMGGCGRQGHPLSTKTALLGSTLIGLSTSLACRILSFSKLTSPGLLTCSLTFFVLQKFRLKTELCEFKRILHQKRRVYSELKEDFNFKFDLIKDDVCPHNPCSYAREWESIQSCKGKIDLVQSDKKRIQIYFQLIQLIETEVKKTCSLIVEHTKFIRNKKNLSATIEAAQELQKNLNCPSLKNEIDAAKAELESIENNCYHLVNLGKAHKNLKEEIDKTRRSLKNYNAEITRTQGLLTKIEEVGSLAISCRKELVNIKANAEKYIEEIKSTKKTSTEEINNRTETLKKLNAQYPLLIKEEILVNKFLNAHSNENHKFGVAYLRKNMEANSWPEDVKDSIINAHDYLKSLEKEKKNCGTLLKIELGCLLDLCKTMYEQLCELAPQAEENFLQNVLTAEERKPFESWRNRIHSANNPPETAFTGFLFLKNMAHSVDLEAPEGRPCDWIGMTKKREESAKALRIKLLFRFHPDRCTTSCKELFASYATKRINQAADVVLGRSPQPVIIG